nr:reverse transcriptase domain-containing protein [Tanacetum cinerariifolium]
MPKIRYHGGTSSRVTEGFSESKDSGGGHWKSKSKRKSQVLWRTICPSHRPESNRGVRPYGLGHACFRRSPARVLQQKLPSAFANHSRKIHHEKVQDDKLKAMKALLYFGDCSKRNLNTHDESQYLESKTPTTKEEPIRRQRHMRSHSPQSTGRVFFRLKQDGSESPRRRSKERREGGKFKRLWKDSPKVKIAEEDIGSQNQKGKIKYCGGRSVPAIGGRKDGRMGDANLVTYVQLYAHWKSKSMANRGDAQSRKVVTFNQGTKAKQWERSGKGSKKEETLGKDKPLAILMENGTEGPVIIEAEMEGHFVRRMYVDGGSSLEILYDHCFNRFRPEVRSQMVPAATPLVGFCGEIIWPLGQISLVIKIGDKEYSTSTWMNFIIVRIIGRPLVRRVHAVPSTAHEMLKFPVTGGTVTLRSNSIIPLECTMVSGLGTHQPIINQVTEEKIKVSIHLEYSIQTIAIGSTITEEGRTELCGLLRRNLDIFAWKLADMTGVPCHIAEHRINIHEGCLPIRQKKKGQELERNKAIYEEVEKLLENVCGFQGLEQSMPQRWLFATGNRLEEFPMLTAPKKEEIIIYLAVAKEAISAVLMMERDGKQVPIYFVIRALQGPKINYTSMEKLILALMVLEPANTYESIGSGIHICSKVQVRCYQQRSRIRSIDARSPDSEANGCKNLHANVNSRLVANQVNGSYIDKNRHDQILGEDALSKMASTSFAHLSKQVLVEELKEKSIDEKEVLAVVEEEGHTWMNPIYEYLTEEILLEEKRKERAIRHKAGGYVVTNGVLYKKFFLRPWLRYVRPIQANYVLREIHDGSCIMHAGPRSVTVKALRSGEQATIQEAKSKAKMEKYYDSRVRNTSFKPGDLVYQNNKSSQEKDEGKLGPKCEGPYEITEALGKGAYKLRDRDENVLPRTWNVCNLKIFYVYKM